jgi:hypothetical protein
MPMRGETIAPAVSRDQDRSRATGTRQEAGETRRVRAQRVLPSHSARNELDWRLICRAAAVAFLVGAALIHAVWMVIHLQEWAWAGIFFLLLALTESALALALIVVPGSRTYVAAIVVSLGTVVVWAVSRTVGMPIGPEAGLPEPVGAPDLMATLFELLTAATLAPLAFTSPDGPSRRGGARGGALTYWAMIGSASTRSGSPRSRSFPRPPGTNKTRYRTTPTLPSPPMATVPMVRRVRIAARPVSISRPGRCLSQTAGSAWLREGASAYTSRTLTTPLTTSRFIETRASWRMYSKATRPPAPAP